MASIAIIGAGKVGQAIGEAWARAGHDVVYGVPDPTSVKYAPLGAGRLMSNGQAAAQVRSSRSQRPGQRRKLLAAISAD